MGKDNSDPGWPSKTGNPSGPGRQNVTPRGKQPKGKQPKGKQPRGK